jgi:NADPH:quinone reductase-like Zn-dependent oxidoreductase
MVTGNGTLQEYQKISASAPIALKPPSLSFTEAAAIPLVYSTVYGALVDEAKLPFEPLNSAVTKQRSVLILGGSSGTGSVAVQLAKKMGLKVVASCSQKNEAFVKCLGADEVRHQLSSRRASTAPT